MRKIGFATLFVFALTALCLSAHAQGQIRAYWVDAFHNGFFTKDQVDKLIEDVKTSNCNMIVAQMRRRGDTYYPSRFEPYAVNADQNFDALAYLIEKAHAQTPKIKVHAWLCTLPISTNSVNPSPFHPYTLYPEYLTKSSSGGTYDGSNYVFDPGNPDALQYIHDVYMDIVKRYNVDGIHYDYVRFASNAYGYNDVSVARFNAKYNRTGKPSRTDADWMQWRRDQITALVRKIYADALAINPMMEISGSTVTWGDGPGTNDDAWFGTSAYTSVFQDWRSWMEEGIMDINMPMTYYRDYDSGYQVMYNNWIEYEKNHKYNRHLAIGPGIYMNYISGSINQIRQALEPSTRGNMADGINQYSYATTNGVKSGSGDTPKPNSDYYNALSKPSAYDPNPVPVFAQPVENPVMPWKANLTKGIIRGTVRQAGGAAVDGADIVLAESERTTFTDGTGFYAFIDMNPGTYNVSAKLGTDVVATGVATVEAGKVVTVNMTLPEGKQIISDDADASVTMEGTWSLMTTGTNFYGTGYRSVPTGGGGGSTITWAPKLTASGLYTVYARWPSRWDNTWKAPYTINYDGGSTTVLCNQATNAGKWIKLGTFPFKAGAGSVVLSDNAPRTATQLRVVADAVKFESFVESLGKIWVRSVPGDIYGSAAAGPDSVFIGDDTGHLYSLQLDDGGFLWKYPNTAAGIGLPILCRPAYDGTNVYFTAGQKAYAVNAATGESVWNNETTPSLGTQGLIGSPVVTATRVYVCADDKRVYALDKATGAVVVQSPVLPGTPSSTPAVPGANVVWVGLDNGDIAALSEDLGTVRFTRTTGGAVVASPNVDMMTGRLFVGSTDGKFYCLNATTGTDVWTPKDIGAPIASSAWIDYRTGIVYFGSGIKAGENPGSAVCALYASTGATAPGFPFVVNGTGKFDSSPVVIPSSNGVPYIYIGSTDGAFYAINASDPARYRVYSSDPAMTVGERLGAFISSPAVLPSAGLVVVGNTNGKIYGMKLQ